MLILGLTGSIGMGKSTVSARFAAQGLPVLDADKEVHRLYAGEAAPLIEAAFPGTVEDGVVVRAKLAAALGGDSAAFKRLEAIVHPLVFEAERTFLRAQAEAGAFAAVLEIPLLFETGGDARVDVRVVVSASPDQQRARVLARDGMSEAKFAAILAQQMSDEDKRARADIVVDTGVALAQTHQQIDDIVERLKADPPPARAYAKHWA